MENKPPQRPKSVQVALIAGAALIIFGIFNLFDQFFGSSWWGTIERMAGTFASFAWPIALIAVGGYLIWAASTGKFKGASFDSSRPFRRSSYDKRIAGVCGGIAQYFNIDSTIVRVVAVILLVMAPGITFLTYMVTAIIAPKD